MSGAVGAVGGRQQPKLALMNSPAAALLTTASSGTSASFPPLIHPARAYLVHIRFVSEQVLGTSIGGMWQPRGCLHFTQRPSSLQRVTSQVDDLPRDQQACSTLIGCVRRSDFAKMRRGSAASLALV